MSVTFLKAPFGVCVYVLEFICAYDVYVGRCRLMHMCYSREGYLELILVSFQILLFVELCNSETFYLSHP